LKSEEIFSALIERELRDEALGRVRDRLDHSCIEVHRRTANFDLQSSMRMGIRRLAIRPKQVAHTCTLPLVERGLVLPIPDEEILEGVSALRTGENWG
jgi:hypothetical protein